MRMARYIQGKGLSDMAEFLGCDVARLSGIEHGRHEPTPKELFLIAGFISGIDPIKTRLMHRQREEQANRFKEIFRSAGVTAHD